MNIIQLLQIIGPDNIKFQVLHDNITAVSETKKGSKITFLTEPGYSFQVLAKVPQRYGLVLWIDKSFIDKAKGKMNEQKN